ncbi:MAG: DUF115 domain-containing protein [Alphaproteobacteria bacterium]
MDETSNPTLFHQNLVALRPFLSDALFSYLMTDSRPGATLVADGDGKLNIDLGGRLLYAPDAETYCRNQVNDFVANPVRRVSLITSNFLFQPDQLGPAGEPFSFTPRPADAGRLAKMLPPPGDRVAGDIARELLPLIDGKALDWFPDRDAGHMVIFGIGLGLHVPILAERLPVRHLILIEQYPEFLKLCLHAVDWRPVTERFSASGGSISFVVGNKPDALAADIIELMRGPAYSRIDGAFFQTHFKTEVFEQTVARIQERSPEIERSQGFFEDELLMIRNTAANLRAGSPRLFYDTGPPRDRKDAERTMMIVGSGPSVTASMPEIQRLRREGVPIISAGTGIGPLLAAGITPDAHCEIENVPELVDVIRAYDPAHLKKVTLLGSTTLDPRIPPLFNDLVYVLRAGLSSSALFAKGFPASGLAGPTVANMACRVAMGLGYSKLLLFGIDLGSKDADRHHADDTLYYTQEGEWWESGNDMAAFVIPVEGNRGGTVYTNQPFLGARSAFETLFRDRKNATVLNCSDGMRIPGAATAEAGEISATEADSAAGFSDQLRNLPSVDGSGADLPAVIAAFATGFQGWADRADRLLASFASRNVDLDALLDAVDALIEPGRDIRKIETHDDLAALCARGSLLSAMQFAHTLYRRMPDDARAEFLTCLTESLRRHIAGMKGKMTRDLKQPD